jgi:hypothetical protein
MLKGSPRMHLLHENFKSLLKMSIKKASILGSKSDARRRLECRILYHLPQSFWPDTHIIKNN